MSLPDGGAGRRERGGIVISGPVAQPMSVRDRVLPDGAAEREQTDHSTCRWPATASASRPRRCAAWCKVLALHFGEMAPEILMRAAPRAGTVPELHALLLAQAGGGIDKKRLAKQLRAIAKLPL